MENYYKALEKKEMLENKMTSIMEVECTAIICLKVTDILSFVYTIFFVVFG